MNGDGKSTLTTPREGPVAPGLLDSSIDCVKAVGLDGRLLAMNPEGQCLMEIDDFTPLRGQAWSSLWPEQHRPTLEAAVARAAGGSVARFSADCPTAKGTPKHWDVVVTPVHTEGGELTSLLAISRDVTREVHIAGQRALVLRELAHRIKNLFAVIDGMVSGSARAAPENRPFADRLRDRIAGLGRAISYVYGDDVQPVPGRTAHGMLDELLKPYVEQRSEAALVIGGDNLVLKERAITPLALVFNELATNALKYGALSRAEGTVEIATALRGEAYEIRWVETGGPPAAQPRAAGFGTTLLERTVGLQLGAAIEREWRPEGLRATITVPVDRL